MRNNLNRLACALRDLLPSFKRRYTLRDAVHRGEMVLFYQPKVDMTTGVTIGVEALLRWQHPKLGLLSPGTFNRAMHEDYDGVIDLGHWVAEAAVRQIDEWQKDGLTMPVSVNVLASELTHGNFCGWLQEVFAKYPSVRPDMLELEVVESSSLGDMTAVMQVLSSCRELGVKIALDDFGTGYSSLSYVRFLPADNVKIDQSFVKDIVFNNQDRGIVHIVIALANNFRCQVIAEGVESVAHGNVLLKLGCRYAQGYAISRPMPAGEVQGWVLQYKGFPEWTGHRLIAPQSSLFS